MTTKLAYKISSYTHGFGASVNVPRPSRPNSPPKSLEHFEIMKKKFNSNKKKLLWQKAGSTLITVPFPVLDALVSGAQSEGCYPTGCSWFLSFLPCPDHHPPG